MKATVTMLAFMITGMPPAPAQVPGDSIRVQVLSSPVWSEGRFVSLDSSSRLTINHSDSTRTYSLHSLDRVEIRRRISVTHAALPWILINEGVVLLAAVTSPKEGTATYVAAAAFGAGLGLTIGAIEVKENPWRWKRVRFGLKAAS